MFAAPVLDPLDLLEDAPPAPTLTVATPAPLEHASEPVAVSTSTSTSTSTSHHDVSWLRELVGLNEQIKAVADISGTVNLTAINAMLVAKRVGKAVAGFGVVALELRLFSQHLDQAMGEVMSIISRMVAVEAHLTGERRREGILARIEQQHIGLALDHLHAQMRVDNTSLDDDIERLATCLQQARRLCDGGIVLARSGRIEAAYGGASSGILQQVSQEVETAIGKIMAILSSLQSTLVNVSRKRAAS